MAEDDFAELLFNLASNDRLALLDAISDQKQRLNKLSKVIDASAQECSRHLARLSDAGFIKKNAEGFYELTPVGKAILALTPGLRFLLNHREYFLSHQLSLLPPEFVERIGELSQADYVNHWSTVLELIKSVISGGREYVLLISDRPIVVGEIGSSFYSKEIPVRLIGEDTLDRKVVDDVGTVLKNGKISTLSSVRIAMAINEKLAGVCFPGLDGRIDFGAGFTGKDPKFLGWCRDLFEYYWIKSDYVPR